jgi:hypothetical protein
MHPSSTRCAFLLAATLALAAGARAAAPDSPSPARAQPDQSALPGADAERPASVATAPAADQLLETTRGGSERTTINTTLTGSVDGNTANHVNTGSNLIQQGSFANMAGIPIVVQNTGANVLIQNATTINLQLK